MSIFEGFVVTVVLLFLVFGLGPLGRWVRRRRLEEQQRQESIQQHSAERTDEGRWEQ